MSAPAMVPVAPEEARLIAYAAMACSGGYGWDLEVAREREDADPFGNYLDRLRLVADFEPLMAGLRIGHVNATVRERRALVTLREQYRRPDGCFTDDLNSRVELAAVEALLSLIREARGEATEVV